MLIRPSCIPDVLEKLKPEEFYQQINRDIFDTIYSMFAYGQTIDPVTLIDRMKVRGVFTDNTEEYLTAYMKEAERPTVFWRHPNA